VGLFAELCAATENALADTETPGVALGLLQDGGEHVGGFGVTSVENPLEVTPDTLFQIGSITKTFTGTVAMALVERGELDLDAPVRRYLPKLELADKDVAAHVTMRHLLTHTAGWVGDYFADHGPGDDALEHMVADLVRLPQLAPLGELWSYNNAGFYLAGRVIEVVTGEPFERVVGSLLLEPLGLEQTLTFAEDVMTRRFAVGHHRNDSGPPTVARPWSIGRAHHAAGGLASSARDLLRYARFHLSDGEGIVSRPSLDEMQRPSVRAESIFGWVGIAWSVDDATGVRIVSHGGGTNGQVSWLAILPDQETAFAIVTNHQRGGEVVAAAKAVLLEAVGAASTERIAVLLDPSEHLGTYCSPLADVELRRGGDGLEVVVRHRGGFPAEDSPPMPDPPPAPVAFYERDKLFVPDGPAKGTEAEFLRGHDGRIAWLRFGGRVMKPAG
jgi:CubicO group peptidase (beta-lactamase class C family)